MAAERGGKIPNDALLLKKMAGLENEPNLQLFISLGFMEPASNPDTTRTQVAHKLPPSCGQSAPREREGRERERERDKNKNKCRAGPTMPSPKVDYKSKAEEVLKFINDTTGRRFKNAKNIIACFKREKCSVEDCRKIIRFKWGEWKGTDMEKHVNPTTPFRASHFQSYLDESGAGVPGKVHTGPTDEFGRPVPKWKLEMIAQHDEAAKLMLEADDGRKQ